MNVPVKHISLDVWQTLIHSNADFRKRRNQLLADHFHIKKPFAFIETAAKNRQAWCTAANELVGKNIDSFEIALLILKDCSVDPNNVTFEELSTFYKHMEALFYEFPPIIIEPKLPLLLGQLKEQEINVSLLSNTGLIKGSTLKKFFELSVLHFNFSLYSDEIGFSKPNSGAFDLVLEKANCLKPILPNEILHIGDNKLADYQGAFSCGFQARLIDHTQVTLPTIISQHVLNHC